jgi:hypothetical protein
MFGVMTFVTDFTPVGQEARLVKGSPGGMGYYHINTLYANYFYSEGG